MNEMKKEIIITADGSHSVAIPELNVSYHSRHGAIQESKHVFIEAGFRYCSGSLDRPDPVRIFEMGFGTGLNAFLTAIEAGEKRIKVYYEAIEEFPLQKEEVDALNYTSVLNNKDLFQQIHECKWNEEVRLNDSNKKEFKEKMLKISKKWSPYRTYACLHLWSWKDNKPNP